MNMGLTAERVQREVQRAQREEAGRVSPIAATRTH